MCKWRSTHIREIESEIFADIPPRTVIATWKYNFTKPTMKPARRFEKLTGWSFDLFVTVGTSAIFEHVSAWFRVLTEKCGMFKRSRNRTWQQDRPQMRDICERCTSLIGPTLGNHYHELNTDYRSVARRDWCVLGRCYTTKNSWSYYASRLTYLHHHS